jgi:hypothetical protein
MWLADGCEARFEHCSIMSRTSEPLIPQPLTARQAMTFRSWASMTKPTRTISPFQQANSKPSEHQRRFERITATLPSWVRPGRRLECFSSRMLCCFIASSVGRRACG